jgi:hypothetical protein
MLGVYAPATAGILCVMVNGDRDGVVEFSGVSRGWVRISTSTAFSIPIFAQLFTSVLS